MKIKLVRNNEAFLYPGQRRLYVLIHLLGIVDDLVAVLSFGAWRLAFNVVEELYWERFVKIEKEW